MRYLAVIGMVLAGLLCLTGCQKKHEVSRRIADEPPARSMDQLKPPEADSPATPDAPDKGSAEKPPARPTAQPPQPQPAPKPTFRIYTIKQGDKGFMSIARTVLGDVHRWKEIRDLNPGVNSTKLRPGLQIKLPAE